MVAYAGALAGIGYATYAVSPPGANAVTALIAPGAGAVLMLLCAGLSLSISSNRKLGMIGIHVGLLIPLLMASGPLMRIGGSFSNADTFNNQLDSLQSAADSGVVLGSVQATGEERRFSMRVESTTGSEELFAIDLESNEGANAWHPASYQAVGLASSIVLSLFAFLVMLLQRPLLPKRSSEAQNNKRDDVD